MTPRTSRSSTGGDVYVTWGMLDRVLELALNPIIEKLDDVHKDVRALRDDRSERSGVARERRRLLDSRRFVVTTLVALIGGLAAAIVTVAWLAAS